MSDGLDEYGPAVAEQPKGGRPSDYTPELAAAICTAIAEGKSLRTICADVDMPDKSTVFRWLAAHKAFRDQYARAREAQADAMAEEILDIADNGTNDFVPVESEAGVSAFRVDHDHISRSRLRVDTRKFLMAKLQPKKYGERVALTGPEGGPVQLERIERVIVKPGTADAASDGGSVPPAT